MRLETIRNKWNRENRAIVTANDTALLVTTSKYANIPAHAYKPDKMENAVEIAWTMGADGQACTCSVYAARQVGDIVLVWTGTLTAGKQVSTDARYWVDTLGGTADTWITTIKEVDEAGADRISRIVFDSAGYSSFFCLYGGISSETVTSYFSGY